MHAFLLRLRVEQDDMNRFWTMVAGCKRHGTGIKRFLGVSIGDVTGGGQERIMKQQRCVLLEGVPLLRNLALQLGKHIQVVFSYLNIDAFSENSHSIIILVSDNTESAAGDGDSSLDWNRWDGRCRALMSVTSAAIGVDMNVLRGYRRGPAPLRKAGGVRMVKEGGVGKEGGGLGHLVAGDGPGQQKKNGPQP